MDNPTQYIPMDDTTRLIIILGLLVPFVVNTITEACLRSKTAKTVLQVIFTIPACSAYVALLGFLFQEKMPGSFVLILLVLGGIVLFILAYHLVAWVLQSLFTSSKPINSSNEPRSDFNTDTEPTSLPKAYAPIESPKIVVDSDPTPKKQNIPLAPQPQPTGISVKAHEPIKTDTSQKPEATSQQPTFKKEEIKQTLTTCLKCGKVLTSSTCNYCRYDHTKKVLLLNRVDPRKLQLAKK